MHTTLLSLWRVSTSFPTPTGSRSPTTSRPLTWWLPAPDGSWGSSTRLSSPTVSYRRSVCTAKDQLDLWLKAFERFYSTPSKLTLKKSPCSYGVSLTFLDNDTWYLIILQLADFCAFRPERRIFVRVPQRRGPVQQESLQVGHQHLQPFCVQLCLSLEGGSFFPSRGWLQLYWSNF